jgi:hypothetical protein
MNINHRLIKLFWQLTALFLISALLISGCSSSPKNSLPGKAFITATNDAGIPDVQQPDPQNSEATTVNLLGEKLTLNNYSLAIPEGWYFSEVNRPNMHGWIFTLQDPAFTEQNGFTEWAGALWAVTPLPDGTSADEFTGNLHSQNYSDSDLTALLIAPEQAGLLDLTEAEALLTNVEIASWGGRPCLKMEGAIRFAGSEELILDITVFLMGQNQDFISYYQFSDSAISSQIRPSFSASLESFGIQQ